MVQFFFRFNETKVCSADDATGKGVRQVISVWDRGFECFDRKSRIFLKMIGSVTLKAYSLL